MASSTLWKMWSFGSDIVDPEALERFLRPRRFQPRHGDGDAVLAAFRIRSSRICAAVKSISTMPLASSTSSFGVVDVLHDLQHVGAEILAR